MGLAPTGSGVTPSSRGVGMPCRARSRDVGMSCTISGMVQEWLSPHFLEGISRRVSGVRSFTHPFRSLYQVGVAVPFLASTLPASLAFLLEMGHGVTMGSVLGVRAPCNTLIFIKNKTLKSIYLTKNLCMLYLCHHIFFFVMMLLSYLISI
jgi:hypothetical protein